MNIIKKQGATLVQRASAKIAGFKTLHKRLEKKIIVSGTSMSTLDNYMRCISHLTLHFNLSLHPHLHCIVPFGGLTRAGDWSSARSDGDFLFPVKAISPVFRARFVSALRRTIKGLNRSFYDALFKTPWVVYAKRPFGGPKQVIGYLGRYTH